MAANYCDDEDANSTEVAVVDYERRHGHFFSTKTFHRPTYSHHCTDLLSGLIGQGYLCEVIEEFSSSGDTKTEDDPEKRLQRERDGKQRDRTEGPLQFARVYDGNCSLKRRQYITVSVLKYAPVQDLFEAALRTVHISDDASNFSITEITDADGGNKHAPDLTHPLQSQLTSHSRSKRPYVFLRCLELDPTCGFISVYPKVLVSDFSPKADVTFKRIAVHQDTTVVQLIQLAMCKPHMLSLRVTPLLVLISVMSGGHQGTQLIRSFQKLLNPHQVYDLMNGGPLHGLHVFRNIPYFKILACGGDGSVGWAESCLNNVGQNTRCQSLPVAIIPLGTGNDLARVLHWGPGYIGEGESMNLLRNVIDVEEIKLDRWTAIFHPNEKETGEIELALANDTNTGQQNEDTTSIFVMNNYFGIGIDADLCLEFHRPREENRMNGLDIRAESAVGPSFGRRRRRAGQLLPAATAWLCGRRRNRRRRR